MLMKDVLYFGKPVTVGCDEQCHKAWGINNRPKRQLSDDPDDYVFLADHELGFAPADPGTYEGECAKPREKSERMNKWCVRECERNAMEDKGTPLTLPDLENPRPNMGSRLCV